MITVILSLLKCAGERNCSGLKGRGEQVDQIERCYFAYVLTII
jgi:hypothetical protein